MKHPSPLRTSRLAAGIALALGAGHASADTTLSLVEVITSPERTATLQAAVDEYEAANPDVTVEITSLPWNEAFEKFATMVASGETPDVVEMPDTWQALYTNGGLLEPLDPWMADWERTAELADKTLEFAKAGGESSTMIPYGFYLRALFYNTKLFEEAGVDGPPATLAEFRDAAEKVSALPGKYGYCLRGGPGGLNGWMMFGAINAGDNAFFDAEGNSTFTSEGWSGGFEFLTDLYQDKLAPPDSVNWGFNEIVTGFYSGTCAMLDQDPDALIAVAERMPAEDFAVAPMPKGPSGKTFPTIGYAGWSMFADSEHKDASWALIAHLLSPEPNLAWSQRVGTLPIYKGAEDNEFYSGPQYAGWFETLNDPDALPTVMPTYLEEFAFFKDQIAIGTSQEALLGQRDAADLAAEWGEYLTEAQQKYLADR